MLAFRLAALTGMLASQAGLGSPSSSRMTQLLEEATARYRALQSAEAVRLYREYLASYSDRADVRVFLGAALLNLNQPAAALEEARRAIRLDPRYAKAYTLAARTYSAQQQWELAIDYFNRALELDGRDADTWYFLGSAQLEAGRYDALLASSLRALKTAGPQSRLYENLARGYAGLGQYAEAEDAYQHALEVDMRAYRPFLSYGLFLFKQGRFPESVKMLQEACRRAPDSSDARFELARVLYQSGRLEDAAQALLSGTPARECRARYLLSRIYSAQGKPDQAGLEVEAMHGCEEPPR